MVRGVKKIWSRVENTSITNLDLKKDYAMIQTYNLLIEEFKTPLEIKAIRGVGISAVYKSINKLMKKGLIKGGCKSTFLKGGEYSVKLPSNNFLWRQHAISFTIEILEPSLFYLNLLKRKTKDEIDNNTLMLEKNILTIYLEKDFFGNDPNEYELKSQNYVKKFIVILENEYKIILKKGRQFYLKEFRCEIEKLNDPFAKKRILENDRLVITDLEDGKQRVITDKSFDGNNLELVKNGKSRKDAKRINFLWNELLDNNISLVELKEDISNSKEWLTNYKYAIETQTKQHEEILLMLKALTIEVTKLKNER